MSAKAKLRQRAIANLGGKCKYCAHSEPLALCVVTDKAGSYTPYQTYVRAAQEYYAKMMRYYLICRNCLASHGSTST